jgi:hypothetical protein
MGDRMIESPIGRRVLPRFNERRTMTAPWLIGKSVLRLKPLYTTFSQKLIYVNNFMRGA